MGDPPTSLAAGDNHDFCLDLLATSEKKYEIPKSKDLILHCDGVYIVIVVFF